MSGETNSPNMGLIIPAVGVTFGPDWASDLNASLLLVDSHDHSSGNGVQITPSGININSDLTFANNDAINLRSARFQVQSASLAVSDDLGCLFVTGVDLYFNDVNGNHVRITQSGAVAGTPGSISNLLSPASAAYVGGSSKFVWQSNTNTAANMDFGAAILRNLTVSSFGLTLQPPTLSSNYSITLPALPASQKIMTLDASGNMAAPYVVDNSTLEIDSNTLRVKAAGITSNELGSASVTSAALATSAINLIMPAGVILAYGAAAAPTGYLLCDGTSYLRATYATLFAAIGTAYGAADGTHFNVPDLRGLFVRGWANGSSYDPDRATRTAATTGGATADNIGSIQNYQIQSHTHTDSGHTHQIANTTDGGGLNGVTPAAGAGYGVSLNNTNTGTAAIQATGGNETRPINLYANYIIKT